MTVCIAVWIDRDSKLKAFISTLILKMSHARSDLVMATGCCQGEASRCSQGQNLSNHKLLGCYLAAIIHDYEHRGVNNDFLIKTGDHLALLYNDSSPMENHHVASAFLLMKEDQFAFFPSQSKRVRENVRGRIVRF